MKTYTISDRETKMLRDIQVSFILNNGLVVLVQIEVHSQFTGFHEVVDLEKFSQSAKLRLETICANWLNDALSFPVKSFNNDDLTIA